MSTLKRFPTIVARTPRTPGEAANVDYTKVVFDNLDDLVKALKDKWNALDPKKLKRVVMKAIKPFEDSYRELAERHKATGNLAKSVNRKYKAYDATSTAVGIAGPKHTGAQAATAESGSGNHAWLIEFGSHGPRRPGGGPKKPALYVQQEVNGRLHGIGAMNSLDFEQAPAGTYFVMGTKNRDPKVSDDKQYIRRLGPNETYGAMPALGWMQSVVEQKSADVNRSIADGLRGILE